MSNYQFQGVDSDHKSTPTLDLSKVFGSKINIREELDKVIRGTGYGSASSIGYLTLTGYNYLRVGQQLVRGNRDNMGYTFFTRPILNLTYDNLSAKRELAMLRNAPANSVGRYVRNTLDPWGSIGHGDTRGSSKLTFNGNDIGLSANAQADQNDRRSPLVNGYDAFIPLLSNELVSLTGWKDVAINDYTSKAGIGNEQWAMPDGYYNIRDTFELTANFRNIEGDPITLLFQTWIQYYMGCRDMDLSPYPNFIVEREYDYNTKIYRFVMDHTKRYIQKWAATIAYPSSISFGQQFNVDSSNNFIDTNTELPITFKCIGADYNDPIVLYEFNETVAQFCPDLKIDYTQFDQKTRSMVVVGKDKWVKLREDEKLRGTYLAVPLINYLTNELEWWIPKDKYITYILPTTTSSKMTNQGGGVGTTKKDYTPPKSKNTSFSSADRNVGDSVTTVGNPFGNIA